MTELRPEIPELPRYMKRLPVDKRGYPVPWFVCWINGEPDFRVIKPNAVATAVTSNVCWVCGKALGRFKAYVVGPMCTVNRVSAEPPSHLDCAMFSVRACPFLVRPHMRRREAGKPEGLVKPPGEMIERNPGVMAVWVITGKLRRMRGTNGLFDIGEPDHVYWFREGRHATRAEILESIESGMPLLEEAARGDGPRAERELARARNEADRFLPVA